MRVANSISLVLVALAALGPCACKKPSPKAEVKTGDWHWPDLPNKEMFREFEQPEEVWSIFLKMVDTARTDEELVSIFSSATASGPGSLHLWEKTFGERWRDQAMATKDLRQRELYRIWGEKSCRDGLQNFYQFASEVPAGTLVPFHADSSKVRFQRTLMKFGPQLALEATDQVDTLTIDENADHEFFASKPLTRGLWRLTALDIAGFREWFLNVDGLPVHAQADADSFEVWSGTSGIVHMKTDSTWRSFPLLADKIFRHVLVADTSREKRIELVVESEGRMAFREIHLPPRNRTRWAKTAIWTDQACYAPGDPARIHGIVRTMGRRGWLEPGDIPPKVQLRLGDRPVEVQPDADGHFQWVERQSEGGGNRSGRLDAQVPADWISPPRPNDPYQDPWVATDGGRWATFLCRRDGVDRSAGSSESLRGGPWPRLGARLDKQLYRQGERARLLVWLEDSTGFVADDLVEVQIRQAQRQSNLSVRMQNGRATAWIPLSGSEDVSVSLHAARVKGFSMGEAFARVIAADSAHPSREALLAVATDREQLKTGGKVRALVHSVFEGAQVLVQARGARLGSAVGGEIRNGVFEASLPVEDLGGHWRLYAHLRTSSGVRTVAATARSVDDHSVPATVGGSLHDGRLAVRVTDAHGRGLRAHLTVSVTTEPSSAPGLESIAHLDTFPDAARIWNVFQPRSLLPWRLSYAHLSSVEWLPLSRREEDRPQVWPVEKVKHPVERISPSDPEDPEAVNFDPSLTADEIMGQWHPAPPQSHLRARPRPVGHWSEDVRTSSGGEATVVLKPLPHGDWWVVVRGTAEGGRVVDYKRRL